MGKKLSLDCSWSTAQCNTIKVCLRASFFREFIYLATNFHTQINSYWLWCFFYCDGTSKNDSGLGFLYSSEQEDIRALLPGDAAYKYINSRFKNDLSSIVASHHGGNRRLDPPPFARSTQSNTNIVYPYGLHNSYGHPGVLRFGEHVHFGWNKDIHTYKGHVGLGISSLPPIGCSTNYCDLRIVQI